MRIDYARVSTTEQNLGVQPNDLKPAYDASVDQTDARKSSCPAPRERVQRPCSRITAAGLRREWVGIRTGFLSPAAGSRLGDLNAGFPIL
jgi:hypothetical protein